MADEGYEGADPSSEASDTSVSDAYGQATQDVGTQDTTPQAEQPWDYSDYADKRVAVKVGGETQYVPLGEAVQGYQRQSDYTRSKQAIAAREQELEYADAVYKAMQLDPERTIQYLQEQFLDSEGQPQAQEGEDLEDLDPIEARLNEAEAWIQTTEQQALEAEVRGEIDALGDTYGQDFDPDAVLDHAIRGNFPTLTAAFRDMQFNTYYGEAKAVRDAREAKEAEMTAQRERAQAGLPATQFVHSGNGSQTGATSSGQPDGRMSVRQAYEAARESY